MVEKRGRKFDDNIENSARKVRKKEGINFNDK